MTCGRVIHWMSKIPLFVFICPRELLSGMAMWRCTQRVWQEVLLQGCG